MNREVVVSVLMPVHNAMNTIANAVQSILNQSFSSFELIIVNDGCTDKTETIINQFEDARIKLITLAEKSGIVHALQVGLKHCNGKYIARMDADDWSYPTRLEEQVGFLKANKEIGVCSSWFILNNKRLVALPDTHEALKYRLFNTNCFAHSGVMFRAELTHKIKPFYDVQYEYTEDLALWMNLVKITQFAHIPKTLLWVNQGKGAHQNNIQKVGSDNVVLRKQYVQWLFNWLDEDEAAFLSEQLNRIIPEKINKPTFIRLIKQFDELYNRQQSIELKEALNQAVWFKLASNAPQSFGWLRLIIAKKYVRLKWWQPIWLLVKPIYLIVKPRA